MKYTILIILTAILFLHCSSASRKKSQNAFVGSTSGAKTDNKKEKEEEYTFFDDDDLQEQSIQENQNFASSASGGEKEVGYAAWYGRELHGKPTASGETFNMNAYTAAHRTYPIGSKILIKNLENNKQKLVRINDRGPYVEGRIIDVSYATARDLGFIERGVAKVEIEPVSKGNFSFSDKAKKTPGGNYIPSENNYSSGDFFFVDGVKPGGYTLQVGAFRIKKNAERYKAEMEERFNKKVFIAIQGKWHYVWIGDFEDSEEARFFMDRLRAEGIEVFYKGKT